MTALPQLDSGGLLPLTQRFAERARQAFYQAIPFPSKPVRAIALIGMGGSAAGGEVLRDYQRSSLPLAVVRGPELPLWIGPEVLVVAVSYSGNTQETLLAVQEAEKRGSAIAAIASGGTLAQWATDKHWPLSWIPAGMQPRAAFPELFFSLLKGLENQLCLDRRELEQALVALEAAQERESDIQALAARLKLAKPLLLGVSPVTEGVARRWQTQLCENSKLTSHVACFPELTHNEIVNLTHGPAEFTALFLPDPTAPALVQRQIGHALRLLAPHLKGLFQVAGNGEGRLAPLLTQVYLGDLLSLHLAFERGQDPSPIEAIAQLKTLMAQDAAL